MSGIIDKTKMNEAAVLACNQLYGESKNANPGLAHLRGANLNEVDLNHSDMRCANLAGAKNLTIKELGTSKTLYNAKLDPGLRDQIEKNYRTFWKNHRISGFN